VWLLLSQGIKEGCATPPLLLCYRSERRERGHGPRAAAGEAGALILRRGQGQAREQGASAAEQPALSPPTGTCWGPHPGYTRGPGSAQAGKGRAPLACRGEGTQGERSPSTSRGAQAGGGAEERRGRRGSGAHRGGGLPEEGSGPSTGHTKSSPTEAPAVAAGGTGVPRRTPGSAYSPWLRWSLSGASGPPPCAAASG